MSTSLVDSSAWVEFLRRRGDPVVKQAVAQLLQSDQASYTCTVRFELLSGVRPEEAGDLERVFSLCRHVPFEPNDWTESAVLEHRLRSAGQTIPRNDLFVAVVALRLGCDLVCRDVHFDVIRGIVEGRLRVRQV